MTHPVSLGGRGPHPEWFTSGGDETAKKRKKVRQDAPHDAGAPPNSGEAAEAPPSRLDPEEGIGTQVDFEA
jgi:hypothetical protein